MVHCFTDHFHDETGVFEVYNRCQLKKVQQSLLLVFARLAVADTPGLLTFLNSTNATQV